MCSSGTGRSPRRRQRRLLRRRPPPVSATSPPRVARLERFVLQPVEVDAHVGRGAFSRRLQESDRHADIARRRPIAVVRRPRARGASASAQARSVSSGTSVAPRSAAWIAARARRLLLVGGLRQAIRRHHVVERLRVGVGELASASTRSARAPRAPLASAAFSSSSVVPGLREAGHHHQQRRAHRAGNRRRGAAAGSGIGTGKRSEQLRDGHVAVESASSRSHIASWLRAIELSLSAVDDAAALDHLLDHRAADADQVGQHAGHDHRIELLAGLEAADRVVRDRSTPRRSAWRRSALLRASCSCRSRRATSRTASTS